MVLGKMGNFQRWGVCILTIMLVTLEVCLIGCYFSRQSPCFPVAHRSGLDLVGCIS